MVREISGINRAQLILSDLHILLLGLFGAWLENVESQLTIEHFVSHILLQHLLLDPVSFKERTKDQAMVSG